MKIVRGSFFVILVGAFMISCTGRGPDGQPCRKNMLQLLPTTATDLSGTCPQTTTYLTPPGAAEATSAP